MNDIKAAKYDKSQSPFGFLPDLDPLPQNGKSTYLVKQSQSPFGFLPDLDCRRAVEKATEKLT